MGSKVHPILEGVLKGRFSALLISLGALFLVGPLIPGDDNFLDGTFNVINLVVLLTCLRAVSRRRGFFLFMVVFTLFNFTLGTVELVAHADAYHFVNALLLARILYYLLVFVSVMGYVLDSGPVTTDKICGAVAAFLLLGIIWAFVYALFFHIDPSSFTLPEAVLANKAAHIGWTFYYSITTLTALGYGDITPVGPAAQSYAVLQAATGQIFVAVIIARLVSLQITDRRESMKESSDES